MKIVVDKIILDRITNILLNFIDKKDFSEITSHIFISAENGTLTLKATDYEIGINYKIKNLNIQIDGQATVNGKNFFDIIKILNNSPTILETDNEHLLIEQNSSKFKLPMFKSSEFPEFPTISNKETFEINPNFFIKSLKKILPAIDTNNPKFELNGCLIQSSQENITFVSTDTKRLAFTQIKNQNEYTKEKSIILPKKAIIELQKLFFETLDIFLDEKVLIVKSTDFEFFTKLINGKFPNYEKIIPHQLNYQIPMSKELIIQNIRRVSIISQDIRITIENQKVLFENLYKENAEAKSSFFINENYSEKIIIQTNGRYITDFLSNIESENFIIGYNNFNVPFMLIDENLKTIIMPITDYK